VDIVVSPTTVALNSQSGSHGATAPAPARAAATDSSLPPGTPVPADPVADAIVALAAQQNGLGPLLANVVTVLQAANLPTSVRVALMQLLTLRPSLERLSPELLRQAVERSGIFLEARLAQTGDIGAPDLRMALLSLREALRSWLEQPLPEPVTNFQPVPPPVPEPLGPPPPYRDAPMTAQAQAQASLAASTPPREIAHVLLTQADSTLARQTLLQAASLPDRTGTSSPGSIRWNLEIPFLLPQGTAVAQLEIARDGRHAPAEGLQASWRVRFTIDIEPIGPVHAHIAVSGARTAVNIWVERQASAVTLGENVSSLADGLRGEALEPGNIVVRAGSPPRQQQPRPSGRFLDRAS
jgi:hypothetical protein